MLRQRMERTAGVPRGLLRFLVLKFLTEESMSGTEIVEKIARETGGKWKPGCGSIYPLLAWLQGKGYTSESTHVEIGMKRYSLTDKGKEFFEEQVRLGQKFLDKLEWLAPMLVGGFQIGGNHENLLIARVSAKRALETFMELHGKQDSLTKLDVKEIAEILEETNMKLRNIVQRVTGKIQAEK